MTTERDIAKGLARLAQSEAAEVVKPAILMLGADTVVSVSGEYCSLTTAGPNFRIVGGLAVVPGDLVLFQRRGADRYVTEVVGRNALDLATAESEAPTVPSGIVVDSTGAVIEDAYGNVVWVEAGDEAAGDEFSYVNSRFRRLNHVWTGSRWWADYEEGEWEPAIAFATPGTSVWTPNPDFTHGRWVRDGNRVTLDLNLFGTMVKGTGSSYLTVTGQPWGAPPIYAYGSLHVGYGFVSSMPVGSVQWVMDVDPSDGLIYLFADVTGSGPEYLTDAYCAASGDIELGGVLSWLLAP